MPRQEGNLDQLACWRSGALKDGGAVDRRGTEGSRQEVSMCGGRGWVEGERGGGDIGWVVPEGVNSDRNGVQKRKRLVLIKECFSSRLSHVPHNYITDT